MSIERACGFKFPQIYSKFVAKDLNSDETVTYVIQDIPESRFQDAIQFMVRQVLPDEPICEFAKIIEDPKAVENCCKEWMKMLAQNVSLVCFKENSDEIVGVNIMKVVRVDDDESLSEVLWL